MSRKNLSKVWQKKASDRLDPVIESYEIGSDRELDGRLFVYELASTNAHARMLARIGVLSRREQSLIAGRIRALHRKYGNTVTLEDGDEDIHSKLESLLTAALGETGKKIHTGRSRNDQVITVLRLFEKEELIRTALDLTDWMEAAVALIRREGGKILPGYTHTKQAMLMTVGFWAGACLEGASDNLRHLRSVLSLIDSNPLGSGSGFGIPLPLDRKMTARLLGFSRVQDNPMAVQNSRGKFEALVIDALWNVLHDFSRMAADLLLFNMDELLYVQPAPSITTGSSVMPQKRNLDVLELVRARTSQMLSFSTAVKSLVTGLHSGYNRDLQETKEPVFRAFRLARESIRAMTVVFRNISFNEKAVESRLSKGIFATDLAFQAVAEGIPFRDAYRHAAGMIENISVDPSLIRSSIRKRVSPGSPGTVSSAKYDRIRKKLSGEFRREMKTLTEHLNALLAGR